MARIPWFKRKRKHRKGLNELGEETPDPTVLEPPVGFIQQPPLREQIRQMVLSERLRQEAEAAGQETFEEADDFDVADDEDPPGTRYELDDETLTRPVDKPESDTKDAGGKGKKGKSKVEPGTDGKEDPEPGDDTEE